MGGGILYNIPIYEELGLTPPKTWDEFMANNEKIKAAGKVAVIQTYADTWTSQLFVLADFFNVLAAQPDFAEKYTAGEAKYATTPAACRASSASSRSTRPAISTRISAPPPTMTASAWLPLAKVHTIRC